MTMRRNFILVLILIFLVSCGQFPSASPSPTNIVYPHASTSTPHPPTQTPSPSLTPSTIPPTLPPSPSPTLTPSITPFTVYYHPDDVLYVGDQVSFEVVSPNGIDVNGSTLQVQVGPPNGPHLGSAKFAPWGIQGRSEAALIWAWDTTTLTSGVYTVEYTVEPQGYTWTDQVTLLPKDDMPLKQADAQWSETQTHCCAVFYITETAAQRDLSALSTMIDAQAKDAIDKMDATFSEPITITLLPRLLGNGGFTSNEISVSYLDRNYASNDWAMVVHHEMIHAIDAHLGGDFRPTIFVEGLAVYLTGGHYKPEPLMRRAAALLDGYLNWYIPLEPLADDFYASQHEIGYLEGASLIEYMIKTYGEPAFMAFYRDIHNKSGESQSASIDAALKAHFSISFAQLEQDFIAALQAEPDTSSWVDDVRLTVTYYETMRRYQQMLDPSAYFRTAWLLDNTAMRQRGIVADYLRHPHTPTNLALETLLITAGQQMSANDYDSAAQTLEQINSVLDSINNTANDPFTVSSLTADYFSISTILQEQGYEVQNINVIENDARTVVTTSTGPQLIPLNLMLRNGEWSISP